MNELTSRYALALFSLKSEQKKLLETQKEIKSLMSVIKENPEYPFVLGSRSLEIDERIKLVEKAFKGVDEDIINLVKVIITNNRSEYLFEIFQDFNSLVNEYRNIDEGYVYSSEPLTNEQIEEITISISKLQSHQVELKNVIDPSLIGGIKVSINGHVYDGSIKHHLEKMKETLLK